MAKKRGIEYNQNGVYGINRIRFRTFTEDHMDWILLYTGWIIFYIILTLLCAFLAILTEIFTFRVVACLLVLLLVMTVLALVSKVYFVCVLLALLWIVSIYIKDEEMTLRYRILPGMAKELKLNMTKDRFEKAQKLIDRCVAVNSLVTKKIKDAFETMISAVEFRFVRRLIVIMTVGMSFYFLLFWYLGLFDSNTLSNRVSFSLFSVDHTVRRFDPDKASVTVEKTRSGADFLDENWLFGKINDLAGDGFLDGNWKETKDRKKARPEENPEKIVKKGDDATGYHIGGKTGDNPITGGEIAAATVRFIKVYSFLFVTVTWLIPWVACIMILTLRRKKKEERMIKQAVADNFKHLLEIKKQYLYDYGRYREELHTFLQDTVFPEKLLLWNPDNDVPRKYISLVDQCFTERYREECYKIYQNGKGGDIEPLINEETDYRNFVVFLLERDMDDVRSSYDDKIDRVATYRGNNIDVHCRFALSPMDKEELWRVMGKCQNLACVFSNNSFTEDAREFAKSIDVLLFTCADSAELSQAIQSMKDEMEAHRMRWEYKLLLKYGK